MNGRAVALAALVVFVLAAGSGSLATHAPVPEVRVVSAVLSDDGDHDGWADTRETIAMRVTVRNLTGVDLNGLVLLVATDDPEISAITDNRIAIGDLADGEIRLSDEAFAFVVGDVDRTDEAQTLSLTFRFRSYADQYDLDALTSGPELTLDLDLDASGGGAATTFFESFETGFGAFTTMHLDETLNPPPGDIGNHALGVAAADGWRCQYADPDWENTLSNNSPQGLVCYPSSDGVPDTYYWHLANERAFVGDQSLHYGVFLDPTALYTTPRAQLEAIRTTEPINLGWANVCAVSRTTFCSSAADCPAGESCTPSAPTFTYKHQVSLMDGRYISGIQDARSRSVDRGIVSVQLASEADGTPIGDWIRLEPFVNVYDSLANSFFFNCTFDPADDGNTEEDFFDPTDPLRSLGPSSTCAPNFNFSFQGNTAGADTSKAGKASDPPGLLGAKGPGAWVEPVFDLSRYRGRRLRIRYLATGLKAGSAPLWHPGAINNTAAPDVRDDGWFVDDARVTDTLTLPASAVPDGKDNSGLPGLDDPDGDGVPLDNCPWDFNPDQSDGDGDGVGDVCDDCPLDSYDDRYGAGACCPATADDDPDGDGLCGAQDTCPGRFNPHGGSAFRVAAHASTGLITSDGQRVVYIASGDLFSVPLTGGMATPLYARPAPDHGGVNRIGQTPDGSTIVFTADAQVAERLELYRVPVTGGAAQLLSAPLQPNGDAFAFLVSPDGSRVVYQADQETDAAFELYSVAIDGGAVVKLNAPLVSGDYIGSGNFAISPDGSRVVYWVRGHDEVWAAPIAGGAPWRLSAPSVEGGGARWFVISGDGSHVVYLAEQEVVGRSELYAVPIGGGAAQKLNGPLPANGDVTYAFATTPDGSQVVYVADETADEVFELYRVGIDGTARTRLTPGVSLAPAQVYTPTLAIAPDGSRAVLQVQTTVGDPWGMPIMALHSVDLAGGPLVQLDSFVLSGTGLRVSPDSSTVVYVDPETGVSSVPIAGGASTSVAAAAGPADELRLLAISPDSSTVLYHSADAAIGGLYVVSLVPDTDTDADGMTFPCDCDPANAAVHAGAPEANDGVDNQCPGDAGWGQVDELASDSVFDASGAFAWAAQAGATMYEVARAATPDFGVGCALATTADPWWADPEEPPAGGAFYYLPRALAPHAGSWGADSAGNERGPLCP